MQPHGNIWQRMRKMSNTPNCVECQGNHTYEYSGVYVCPDCGHEWSIFLEEMEQEAAELKAEQEAVRDSNGTTLEEGDEAIVVNDIRFGGSNVIKRGTKVQNIRLEENGPHNIVARVDGFGLMELKSELIRKA